MRSRCTVDVEGTPDGLEWWARASCGWSSFRGPRDQADFWAAEHAGEHRAGLVGPRGADRPTPDSVLRSWPAIDPSTWEWLSPHRLRAPHEMVLDAVTLVVVAFGETVGQNLGPGHSAQQVQETYALLFADAARLAAHRLACEDATPLVNNDGRCPLCGTWPTDHEDPTEGTDA